MLMSPGKVSPNQYIENSEKPRKRGVIGNHTPKC